MQREAIKRSYGCLSWKRPNAATQTVSRDVLLSVTLASLRMRVAATC